MLIGLYFNAAMRGANPATQGTNGNWTRTVALLQGIQSLPKAISLPVLSQEGLVLAFRELQVRNDHQ